MSEKILYAIGKFIGTIFGTVIGAILGLFLQGVLYFGTIMKKYPLLPVALILAYIVFFITSGKYALIYTFTLFFIVVFPIFVIIGSWQHLLTRPQRKINDQFAKIFESIKLVSGDGQYPFYIGADENEYILLHAFKTVIPLEEWKKKQPLLETYLNTKIIDIENHLNDNNIVVIAIEKQPLPSYVAWNVNEHIASQDYISLGIDHSGIIPIDLNNSPHIFIAGETGSGKTNLIKCIIYQTIIKCYDVKLIDFKRGVSFVAFADYVEIYSDYDKIKLLLKSIVKETNDRLDLLREHKVEDIKEYNKITGCTMKRMVVFIDELAELMRSGDKDGNKAITSDLETVTRLARAVGIHLVMGLQRPDATIINGQIKNNVSTRICGRFVDPEPSRIMLGNDSAMHLPDVKGRFIIKGSITRTFQAFCIDNSSMDFDFLGIKKIERIQESQSKVSKKQPTKQETNKPKTDIKALDFNFDDII